MGERLTEGIAIVGLSGRFPGADSVESFWQSLKSAVKPEITAVNSTWFDAAFFGYEHEEATKLTKEARVLLESAWEAFEDAGYDSQKIAGTVAVFAAANLVTSLIKQPDLGDSEPNNLAVQIATKLSCRGEAITLQGGAEAALAAVHLACQNLLNQQSELALVGAVTLEAEVAEVEGSNEQGRVTGEAVGVVILKRLSVALRDRDHVYGVIRGTAMATMESGVGQTLKLALTRANLAAATVGYFETYLTGKADLDLRRLQELIGVFQSETKASSFCVLDWGLVNSAQSRVAAGMVSLIKTALILKHQSFLPLQNELELEVEWSATPFYRNREDKVWAAGATPRRAVVNFRAAGSEVALVLEEAPMASESVTVPTQAELILLATQTAAAQLVLRQNLADYLARHAELEVKDLAYTLQSGRRAWLYRSAVVAESLESLIEKLRLTEAESTLATTPPPLIWIFNGRVSGAELQQSAYLYREFAFFREIVDEVAPLFLQLLGRDLRPLFAASVPEQVELLREIEYAEPVLFLLEYALAQQWLAWGMQPAALFGYDLGEYVTACLAGVFSLADALRIVVARARVLTKLPTGKLLQVDALNLKEQLPTGVELVVINGAKLGLFSGTKKALGAWQTALVKRGVAVTELSEVAILRGQANANMMAELMETINKVTLNAPGLPYLSNLTGTWITETEAVNPDYYLKQFKQPIKFYQAIQTLQSRMTEAVWLEFGSGTLAQVLRGMVGTAESLNVFGGGEGTEVRAALFITLGRLWQRGYELPWERIMGRDRGRISLPTYPFERVNCVLEAVEELVTENNVEIEPAEPNLAEQALWLPTWQKVPLLKSDLNPVKSEGTCLIFEDTLGLGERLAKILQREYRQVIRVRQGTQFTQAATGLWLIRSGHEEDLLALISELAGLGNLPRTIYFLWLYDQANPSKPSDQRRVVQNGFETLLKLAKVLAQQMEISALQMQIICNNLMAVAGENRIFPEKGLITGLCRSLESDLPGLATKIIDLPAPITKQSKLWQELLNELRETADPLVLLRQTGRWLPTYERLTTPRLNSTLKKAGSYLITGGLTGLGQELALYLAEQYQAKIVILSRTAFPERETWDTYHFQARAKLANVRMIAKIKELESKGAVFEIITADVANYVALEEVFEICQKKGFKLDGIFHAAGVERRKLLVHQDLLRAKQVLAPKVNGTRNLVTLASEYQVQFLMLYSAMTSLTWCLGEPDTAAANSFLNHYAAALQLETNLKVLAVCWDFWAESGRAARAGLTVKRPLLPGVSGSGLLDNLECQADGSFLFQKSFTLTNDWVVSEHLYQGMGIVPGTAWIGMIYQAAAYIDSNVNWTISKLKFLLPCKVVDGTVREVTLKMKLKEKGFSLRITSHEAGEELIHVRGFLNQLTEVLPETKQQFETFKAKLRVTPNDLLFEAVNRSGQVQWGPRWQTMQSLVQIENQYFAFLSLKSNFHADLEQYLWHPALLDTALALTAFWDQNTVMLPASYQSITLFGSLPAQIYTLVTIDEAASIPQTKIIAEVTLFDEQGRIVGKVNKFELQRIPKHSLVQPVLAEAIPLAAGLKLTELLTGMEQTAAIVVSFRELPELIMNKTHQAEILEEEMELELDSENASLEFEAFEGGESIVAAELMIELPETSEELPEIVAKLPIELELTPEVILAEAEVAVVVSEAPVVLVAEAAPVVNELPVETVPLETPELITATDETTLINAEVAVPTESSGLEVSNQELPLSFQQLRSYFLYQFYEGRQPEPLMTVVRLRGRIERVLFEQALQLLVKQHEILRTVFVNQGAEPQEQLLEPEEIQLEYYDLSDLEILEQRKQSEEIVANYRKHLFKLQVGALVKFGIIALSSSEAIFCNLLQPIIADHFSQKLLLNELVNYYNRILVEGVLTALKPVPQYREYRWAQEYQWSGEWLTAEQNYWREKLAGIGALNLPTDRPRNTFKGCKSSSLEFVIPIELVEVLHRAVKEYQTDLLTILLSITAMLFYRYSAQENFVIGTFQDTRTEELLEVCGPLENNLALVCELKPNDNFLTLLKRIQRNLREALTHQALPFEKVIEAVNPERNLSQTPIFQVMLGLRRKLPLVNNQAGISSESEVFYSGTSPYDLRFNFIENSLELNGTIDYSTELFEAMTIKRMAAHLMMLLEAALKYSDLPVSQLEMLTSVEKQMLLKNWNSETMILPMEKTVMERFEKIVGSYGSRIALVDQRQQYTYTKLNDLATNVARYLVNQELSFGSKVALAFRSASKLVISLLGVLKIGATYLQLDSNWSAEQMKIVLAESGARLVIADYDLAPELEARHYEKVQLVGRVLEEERITLKKPPADSLAYLVYTFSTPTTLQGVRVNHANLIAAIWARYKFYQDPIESLLNLYPLLESGAVANIYGTLLSGNKLILVDQTEFLNTGMIVEMMRSHQVSYLAGAAKYYHNLLQNPQLAMVRSLKVVSLGAEVELIPLAQEHYQVLPEVALVSEYGYTETTMAITSYWYNGKERDLIPIGKPLANTQVYLLDQFLQPVPVGVVGELYVGGEQVADGYDQNDLLNQTRFLPDLFNGGRKAKLFRTGDLARWLPEGQLELLGRNTDLIKVRGFWVDLKKIEATLLEISPIMACVVLAEQDLGTGLLALLQPAAGVMLDLQQIRNELTLRLPAYLIPTKLLEVEQLPLNEQGQIEHGVLRELIELDTTKELNAPPTNDQETRLVEIWKELLNLTELGIDQNFFQLGGNSRLGMEMIVKTEQAGLDLKLKELFAYPTIRQLGQVSHIERTGEKLNLDEGQSLTLLQRWFLEELPRQKQPTRWNANLLLKFDVPLVYPQLVEAFLAVYHHHSSLRAKFLKTETGWVQMIAPPENIAPISYLDLRQYPNEQGIILETICDRRQNKFILEQGKLIQLILFRMGENDYRLWLNAHRLLVDGISLMIILDELMLAYQQLVSGVAINLPQEITTPGEWSKQLEAEVRGKILPAEKEYWLSLPWDQIASLPVDFSETASQNTVGSLCDYVTSFTSEATKSLQYFAETSGIEIANLLLGALLQAVTDWTGREYQDLTVLHNGRDLLPERTELDVKRTVGWLSLERLLVLKRSAATTSGEIIRELNQQMLKIPNDGHGYNLLRYMGGNEMLSAALARLQKRPGILFNYQPIANTAIIKKWGIGRAVENIGMDEHLESLRFNLLELHVFVENEQLYLFWRYSKNVHREETIIKLNSSLCNLLGGLVTY